MTTETMEQPRETSTAEQTRTGPVYRPNADILEHGDELIVMADLPGATTGENDIKFEDGVLEIYARVKPRQSPETELLLREYGTGDFYRAFRVSEQIDPTRITAEFGDGVLTLHLPKSEAAKPRKIAVNVK